VAEGHRHHVERDSEVGGQPHEQRTTRLSAGRPALLARGGGGLSCLLSAISALGLAVSTPTCGSTSSASWVGHTRPVGSACPGQLLQVMGVAQPVRGQLVLPVATSPAWTASPAKVGRDAGGHRGLAVLSFPGELALRCCAGDVDRVPPVSRTDHRSHRSARPGPPQAVPQRSPGTRPGGPPRPYQ